MSDKLRRLAKEAAGRALYATGQHRRSLRGRALVVAFHTIGETGANNSIQVSTELFRDYCAFFKRYFDVVRLSELLDDLDASRDVSGKLVITFDDGYRDNYTHAAPVLESHGLPATFFVTTDFIGSTSVPWWDRDSGVQSEWMSWDDVIDLDRRGFDIGAHTRTHSNLRFNSREAASSEIAGSKAEIEHRLGHAIAHFAYPYGRREDSSAMVRELVKEAGFRCCMSCHGGLIGIGSDVLELPRLPINDWHGSSYQFGLDAVRDVTVAGGEYADVAPAGDRVLVVSYHLYPDGAVGARRPSELMRFLAGKGYVVDGLGGRPGVGMQTDPDLASRLEGFRVMRVPQPPSVTDWLWKQLKSLWRLVARRDSSSPMLARDPESRTRAGRLEAQEKPTDWLRRQYNALYSLYDAHKLWALLAVVRLFFSWRRYDIVISSGPPSASHLVGYLAARLSGARYVMDFRDPWVGNLHVSQASDSRLRRWFERRAESMCVERAAIAAATTPGIERMLSRRYPDHAHKVHVIYNGFDGDPVAPQAGRLERVDMLYAGTLYFNRNPFPLLEGLKLFLERPGVVRSKVSLTLAGSCENWNGQSLREWIVANAISDVVRILPLVSHNDVDTLTKGCTVLVNLAQGQPDQIPAKTFEQIASGKAIMTFAESGSDTASLVSRMSHSILVESDNPEAVAAALWNISIGPRQNESSRADRCDPTSDFSRSAQFSRLTLAIERPVIGRTQE